MCESSSKGSYEPRDLFGVQLEVNVLLIILQSISINHVGRDNGVPFNRQTCIPIEVEISTSLFHIYCNVIFKSSFFVICCIFTTIFM